MHLQERRLGAHGLLVIAQGGLIGQQPRAILRRWLLESRVCGTASI
jgi:hypothetical protein